MTLPDGSVLGAGAPLSPVYPFNDPGEPVKLYQGLLGGAVGSDVPGEVELVCAPRPSLEWCVESVYIPAVRNMTVSSLVLQHRPGVAEIPVHVWDGNGGWSNGATLGRADASLQRITAHWFNLPNWHGPERLTAATPGGGQTWWSGRWGAEIGGWRITIDVRPDYERVWSELHKTDVYVMTHVMEIRRADVAMFTAADAEPLLAALHIGVSFALGRWAAPMLPVGQSGDGQVIWEDWRPLHCDAARQVSPGWWYERDHQSLGDFLSLVVPAFADPARRALLRSS